MFFFFFFFSSRRRHTRFDCDWSSDVCSSDLLLRVRTGLPKPAPSFPWPPTRPAESPDGIRCPGPARIRRGPSRHGRRSEEHTSELQSQSNLVCRLLLEKKKQTHPSAPIAGEP